MCDQCVALTIAGTRPVGVQYNVQLIELTLVPKIHELCARVLPALDDVPTLHLARSLP
jgi:hypothetical protein